MLLNNVTVVTTSSPEETRSLGTLLGGSGYAGLTVLLYGALGMGKTLLTSGIGSALGYDNIKSPTFIIISEHEGDLSLVHADLYRLETYAETDLLDLESYIDRGCLLVVEWAEHWGSPPSKDRWDITIKPAENDEGENIREITIRPFGNKAFGKLCGAISQIPSCGGGM